MNHLNTIFMALISLDMQQTQKMDCFTGLIALSFFKTTLQKIHQWRSHHGVSRCADLAVNLIVRKGMSVYACDGHACRSEGL
jgi:hypothetical protein